MPKRRKSITELARELRENPTESESILWEQLRKRRLGGYRFVRQKPLVYDQNKNNVFSSLQIFIVPRKRQ
ncbi:MAG: DUF559 domain-containing protein [Bacteroidetes bacterium]|jgi:leucyl-tRNA synthetase|nr:DUF559 domain-containing protein [Bacteroidota bacterium]